MRYRDRQSGTLFRGGELPRLATLVVMLGVLVMLISRASDPGVWRWLVPESTAPESAGPPVVPEAVAVAEPAASGPTDRDPEELEAAREEFQAVTDKAPLAKEEMPAYWRLLAWQQHQSLAGLRERAKKDVTFRQLWQQPDQWRGQLVEIPLYVRQTAKVENLEDNPLGLKTMEEIWGWNYDSGHNLFWLICPVLPPGMPSGQKASDERATFVGYFLKLQPYEDHQGVSRAIPLLIGRLVWHPLEGGSPAKSDEWMWPWFVAGGLAILYAARWGARWLAHRQTASGRSTPRSGGKPGIDDWLESAEGGRLQHEPSRASGQPDGDRELTGPSTWDEG